MPESKIYDDFIRQLLITYDIHLEKDDVGAKADQILRRIEETKFEFLGRLENKFASCSGNVERTDTLFKECEIVGCKAEDVKYKLLRQVTLIKELSPVECDSLASKLERINKILSILSHMKVLNKGLHLLQKSVDDQQYLEAAKALKCIECHKGSVTASELAKYLALKEPKYLQLLNKTGDQLRETLVKKLHELFLEKIPQIVNGDSDLIKLTISDKVPAELWMEIIKSMHELKILEPEAKKLSKNLYSKVFEKIIQYNSSVEDIDGALIIKKIPPDGEREVVNSKKTIRNVEKVIEFLDRGLKAEGDVPNLCMGLLGNNMAFQIFKELNEKVIKKATPNSSKELKEFGDLISSIKKCQSVAHRCSFINCNKDYVQLLIGEAEKAFVTRKCEDIIVETRRLLKLPLHEAVEVGSDPMMTSDVKPNLPTTFNIHPLFDLPKCQISKSIKEMWSRIEDLIGDLSTNRLVVSEDVAVYLYEAIRKVLQLFVSIVPLHHLEVIQNLPFVAAIHHNNCMFLAHNSAIMERKLEEDFLSLPPTSSILDYVASLRSMAVKSFHDMLLQQRNEIVDDLRSPTSGYSNISEGENSDELERSIKRVSLKLRRLNSIWKDVMPSICQKSLGFLLDASLAEVMNNIIHLEDISEDDSQQFVGFLSTFEQLGAEFFPTDDANGPTVFHCVESWSKMKELKFILNARLIEITDRWSLGKGPLAEEFTSEELDRLVRALFQNTEMRSAVLASISR